MNTTPNLPKLSVNLEETSQITGFSERSIRRFAQRGLLHPTRVSRRLIFTLTEIKRFLDSSTAS